MHSTQYTLSANVRSQPRELWNKHLAAAIELRAQVNLAHWNFFHTTSVLAWETVRRLTPSTRLASPTCRES